MRELSLHILDIMQNSIAAKADLIKLSIEEDSKNDLLTIKIIDNGQGMDEEKTQSVLDPFVTSRKTREVGLGLPLLKNATERSEGKLVLRSIPGKGTEVLATFRYSHIDRAPLGDVVETLMSLMAVNSEIDFSYLHIIDGKEFVFETEKIKSELGKIKINDSQVLHWIEGFLREGLKEIRGGEL